MIKITKKNDKTQEITDLLRQILETLQGLNINISLGRDNNGIIIIGNNNRSNSATDNKNVRQDLITEI